MEIKEKQPELTEEEAEIWEIISPICSPETTEEVKKEFVRRFFEIKMLREIDD